MLLSIPLYVSRVQAGFPSPAGDSIEERLDFNKLLVKKPSATFCLRVKGDSMINAGIFEGDILVVDRSLTPVNNHIVIAAVNGELTVKRLRKVGSSLHLVPENSNFEPIPITAEMDFQIWGVVTSSIRNLNVRPG